MFIRLCSSRCGFAKKKNFSFKFLLHPKCWFVQAALDEKFKPKVGLTVKQKYWRLFTLDNSFQKCWELKCGPIEMGWHNVK